MTIRGRLTLWFTCLFGVIIASLAIASFLIVKRQAYSKLDTSLQVAAGGTVMSAEHELAEHNDKAGGEADIRDVLAESANPALQDTQILVREGERVVAFKRVKGGPDLSTLPLDGIRGTGTIARLRVQESVLQAPQFQTKYEIYAAKPTWHAAAQVASMRWLLFLLVPVGLALAGAAGYVLASRTLKPLQDFALVVDAVTSSDLGARVKPGSYGDEISNLGLRFNALLERLEYAFTLQRRFMSDASHQIRTPVTVALAAAQVGTRDPKMTAGELRESLQTVEKQMLQLRRIVDDMFFLSQTDTAPLKIQRKEMYLDDAVAEAARAALALSREKEQHVRMSGLPEARCLGDVDLLTQAVLVLLDNAIKFTPKDGTITVGLAQRGAEWVCTISDTGLGIPEQDQQRIFERFFQVNREGREQRKGAGLGLSIAKSIAETHNGHLTLVESRPGRTVFEISVPAVEETPALEMVAQANSSAVKM